MQYLSWVLIDSNSQENKHWEPFNYWIIYAITDGRSRLISLIWYIINMYVRLMLMFMRNYLIIKKVSFFIEARQWLFGHCSIAKANWTWFSWIGDRLFLGFWRIYFWVKSLLLWALNIFCLFMDCLQVLYLLEQPLLCL